MNLGQGFPDYAMPDFVKEAAVEAIRADYNQYSRPAGHARLVEKLASRYSPRFGRSIDAYTEIGVVGGATNAFLALGIGRPDDEVVCVGLIRCAEDRRGFDGGDDDRRAMART